MNRYFRHSIFIGDLNSAYIVLQYSASVNNQDLIGSTSLHYAVTKSHSSKI